MGGVEEEQWQLRVLVFTDTVHTIEMGTHALQYTSTHTRYTHNTYTQTLSHTHECSTHTQAHHTQTLTCTLTN